MIQLKDFAKGEVNTLGPYSEVRFLCINQSFPVSANEPTVTYSVITPEGTMDTVTVSLVHSVESVSECKQNGATIYSIKFRYDNGAEFTCEAYATDTHTAEESMIDCITAMQKNGAILLSVARENRFDEEE